MAKPKQLPKVRVVGKGNVVTATLPAEPVEGGNRQLLPRNGTAHAPGNIEKV